MVPRTMKYMLSIATKSPRIMEHLPLPWVYVLVIDYVILRCSRLGLRASGLL